jgi:hypothetical protein
VVRFELRNLPCNYALDVHIDTKVGLVSSMHLVSSHSLCKI